MKVTCGICRDEKEAEDCHVVELNEDEKKYLTDQGFEPMGKFHYCRSCWRLMKGPNAVNFMKNRVEGAMQQLGVPRKLARKQADLYKTKLLEISKNANRH